MLHVSDGYSPWNQFLDATHYKYRLPYCFNKNISWHIVCETTMTVLFIQTAVFEKLGTLYPVAGRLA